MFVFAINGITFRTAGGRKCDITAYAEDGTALDTFNVRDFTYASTDRDCIVAAQAFIMFNPHITRR